MNRFAIGLAGLLLLFSCPPSRADWYLIKDTNEPEHQMEQIPDEDVNFVLGGMKCGVSKSFFSKLSNAVFESRDLYCWVSSETQVSIRNSSEISKKHQPESMQIKKAGKTYWPSLIYRNEKK